MKVFAWGTGKIAKYIFEMFDLEKSFTILGLIDNDEKKWGKYFENYPIYSPSVLTERECERILILCNSEDEIICQLEGMGVPLIKLIRYSQMEIGRLVMRSVKIAYLTGDYYVKINEANIPNTVSVTNKNECDKFIINDYMQTKEYCSQKYSIPMEKIEDIGFILKHQYYELYCQNYDNLDEEERECIRKVVLSVENIVFFFDSIDKHKRTKVYFDKEKGLRYVDFFGKKLYLSRKMEICFDNEKEEVLNLWFEQDNDSPHKYFKNCDVKGVVVDCGVCEGNFSLYNIDKIDKLFLIECDEGWVEALQATFEPYKDKVIICNKYLGSKCDGEHITLDALLAGIEPDYIKMDIEGDEVEALHGAETLLKNNRNCRWNVCVYHKKNHADIISEIFVKHGIETEFSRGFINFIYDKDILNNYGLRKCLLCTK